MRAEGVKKMWRKKRQRRMCRILMTWHAHAWVGGVAGGHHQPLDTSSPRR